MYTQVENYGEQLRHHADGSAVKIPSLVEDEHGLRLLICAELIPQQAWADAARSGARGLLQLHPDGARYSTREQFAQHRTENRFTAAYELADRHWVSVSYGMSVPQMDGAWGERAQGDNPFVHLHTHTEFSALDGLSTCEEIGDQVSADKQSAVAITDHGICSGHPAFQKMTSERGLHPVYGIEAYFTDDRFAREDASDYTHLVLWAETDEGLRNLWSASTESWRDGFYSVPRMDWDTLARHQEGLLVSSACLRGPVLRPYLNENEELALTNLARLGEIFGDRFYLELHTNLLPQQVRANQWLIDVSRKYRVPLVAAVDSHYATAPEKTDHRVWLAMQTDASASEESSLFGGDQEYHLMTVEEVRRSLAYLPEPDVEAAIANTGAVAKRCTAEIRPQQIMPRFSRPTERHPDPVQHDAERMLDTAIANFEARVIAKGRDPARYLGPLEYEAGLLVEKGYPGYYMITADYVTWAKDHGILVGPGRGSGAASLVAYLMRITEIDPIDRELLLDRFMTKGRKSLPDFDIDFPSSRADDVINYVRERWGAEHVARVGTHGRIQNKSAFRDVQRAIADTLPGESYGWVTTINKLIDAAEASTAGLGLQWDELHTQIGELLDPYRERMPELFRLAERFRGRLKLYSKHAAGIIIDTDRSLEDELPMRRGDGPDAPMVTQFDMDALDHLGKVKFDFLFLRNLDTIQDTVDAVREKTGRTIKIYDWVEEYSDPEVYDEISDGWTMGVFQIETSLGTRTVKDLRPRNLAEWADSITLGRPGPMRSGLDKLYKRRRAGETEVVFTDPRLAQILAKTYGVMLYQEDIMAICSSLAGYDSDEADLVRKILGKKKIELVEEEGRRFIERAVANQTDKQVALDLWEQMAEFSRYAFNRAHADAYATLGYWTAWLKVHYPREFLVAVMATVKKERIPQFVTEARRLGYRVLPPDINDSRLGFNAEGVVIRYGLASVLNIGDAVAYAVMEAQPYTDYDDFLERKGGKCNMGHVKRLAAIGAFDSIAPHRKALEARIADDTTGVSDHCSFLNREQVNAFNLPCNFDWSSEPIQLGRTGKPLKKQLVPPKKCTKACRHYTKREPVDYTHTLTPYTKQEIRDREAELLGVYLSSSPFDIIPIDVMATMLSADDLSVAEPGVYPFVGVVLSIRLDPKGRNFGFASVSTPSGEMSMILYQREWERYSRMMRKGRMVIGAVLKSADDRYRLTLIESLDTGGDGNG